MRAMGRPGGRLPLACTAMGQAILAAMSETRVSEYLHKYGLPRLTPNSIARPGKLHEVLEQVRRTGYAVDHEENAAGLRCVAAVICNEAAEPVAALSIAGPTVRLTLGRVAEIGRQVTDAAREVTAAIGGRAVPFQK